RAAEVIHGYTVANDVTARDLQRKDGQFTRAKGFDTFCPLGPWIETELDPSAVSVQTYRNGDLVQDGNTSDLVFDIPTLVAYVSECTSDEVAARRKISGSKVLGYDGFCRELTDEQTAAFVADGRLPVVRFRRPDGSITWHDLVRGDVTFETQFVPDYALCRTN